MPVPGIRILVKNIKKHAFIFFVTVACCAVLLILFNPDFLQRDVQKVQSEQPSQEVQPKETPPKAAQQGQDDQQHQQRFQDLELAQVKLQNKLLEEKLKAAQLKEELNQAYQQQNAGTPSAQQQPKNAYQRKQYLRLGALQQGCAEHRRVPGAIHTVIASKEGVTLCHIPRTYDAFWLKVYRYINRDFFEDVQNPLDISTRNAIERPFIRTKLLRWTKIRPPQKSELLNTKVILAVENPYERLYNIYVSSFMLPELWDKVGAKIEAKRQAPVNEFGQEDKTPRRVCGGSVTFVEFLKYALESGEADYAPVYQLCDACQLNPSYVVRKETARQDTEGVLQNFNLAWILQEKYYDHKAAIRFIEQTIKDNFDRLQRAQVLKCGNPSSLGSRLWKVFAMEGILEERSKYVPIDRRVERETLIKNVTDQHLKVRSTRSDYNARSWKVNQIVHAYGKVKQNIIEQIQRKYIMDFQLLGYSQNVNELDKETY